MTSNVFVYRNGELADLLIGGKDVGRSLALQDAVTAGSRTYIEPREYHLNYDEHGELGFPLNLSKANIIQVVQFPSESINGAMSINVNMGEYIEVIVEMGAAIELALVPTPERVMLTYTYPSVTTIINSGIVNYSII